MEEPLRGSERATLKRTPVSTMPPFCAESGAPLYVQVCDYLRQAIQRGRFARLPSTRALAMGLGISRNTVLAAYETLAAEGLVRGRTGSGTEVIGKMRRRRNLPALLRDSHYPVDAVALRDPDGHSLQIQRLPN